MGMIFMFLPVAVILQGDLDPLASLKSLTYLRYGNYVVVTVESFKMTLLPSLILK